MSLKDWSVTAASNTSAPPNGWPEGMTIANVNNTGREMMAALRNLAAEDTIASATTCDLGTKDATFLTITGTTTITGFGTVSAGIYKLVKFSGALTLTHNATSLILLTGANRTTVAGDCALYKSEGSGNWREYFYSNQNDYQPLDTTLTALAGALTAANKIPYATALDTLGELDFKDEDNMASNSATALPSQQSVKAYVDTQIAAIPDGTTLGTERTLPAAATDTFGSLPAGLKRVTVMFDSVSTNGTSPLLLRVGDSGGVETTGYVSGAVEHVSTNSFSTSRTDGYVLVFDEAAADVVHGSITLARMDTAHTWLISGTFINTNGSYNGYVSGTKTLSAELTQIQLTTVNGTDVFDGGTWNILYD